MYVMQVTLRVDTMGYICRIRLFTALVCGLHPTQLLPMVIALGYASAILIGVLLGLMGGGGAVIVVPVLVYLFSKDAVTATAYSLFIVSIAAFVGFLRNLVKGMVDVRTGLVFAVPAFVATYAMRAWVVPALPQELGTIGSLLVTLDMLILGVFAATMAIAAVSMIRSKKREASEGPVSINYIKVMLEGLGVGALTGLIGVGGGFLIVPALVLLANVPMKKAVGTSLMIIAIKSMIGFMGDLNAGLEPEWTFLFAFSGLALAGIFIGTWLGTKISGAKLKTLFGWFVLAMAVFITAQLVAG